MDTRNKIYSLILIAGFGYGIASCNQNKTTENTESVKAQTSNLTEADQALIKRAGQLFGSLPEINEAISETEKNKIALGKALYFDARLSKSGVISCNSCHNIATYGVDNLPTSPGHKWQFGGRNSPTSFNAALHKMQFWDGRAENVEEQAKGPILNPVEMATPHEDFAVNRIASIPTYETWFKNAFPNKEKPITYNNIANAIGAFERTLITPSRFDKYLKGDGNALTADEKKGMETFINVGCVTCHLGNAIGGSTFQKFGVNKDYWALTGSKNKDEGRKDVTKSEADKYFFKVPGLRNIEHTYPYFHDGSIWDLKEAIAIMSEIQLNKKLNADEINSIEAFLQSLTGELPKEALTLPVLPASTANTSKPDFK